MILSAGQEVGSPTRKQYLVNAAAVKHVQRGGDIDTARNVKYRKEQFLDEKVK